MLQRLQLLETAITSSPTGAELTTNHTSEQSHPNPTMSLKYNKVLIIGATSGIGLAYAEKVVADGKFCIVTGRRKENLDGFASKHGSEKAEAIVFDITKIGQIPAFAEDITKRHPDLDCVILNSGIQRPFDFTKPETVDMDLFELEFTTNYLSYVHLTKAFLSHLQKQEKETALIYTSSGLALIPLVARPNYCASKAALHHFILALREQMKFGPGNVKIIEIFPPAVQTELHDEKHQPDIKNGRQMGMPLDEFTKDSWGKLVRGDEQVPVGMSVGLFEKFEWERQKAFHHLDSMVRKGAH